jgi:hypothetical protein
MSSQAYTPGLKRKELYMVRKSRILPIPGDVLVKEGDNVSPNSSVARTQVPGAPHMINVSYELGIIAEDILRFMKKKNGDSITKDELLAFKKGFFGMFKKEFLSPYTGTVEHVSNITGQVIIRESPIPVTLKAYISGTIEKVIPKQGVIVKTPARFIQGIFGIGGETFGEIMILSKKVEDISNSEDITAKCKDKILVFGSLVDLETVRKAIEIGVRGIIVGGIKGTDLTELLGSQIGVAITGRETIGLTLIITEGFGRMSMSDKTFDLLKRSEGKFASINGATQIRAGVMRPEIIIPQTDLSSTQLNKLDKDEKSLSGGLTIGTLIRIIREPYFGALGEVTNMPVTLLKIKSESNVRVLEAKLEDGRIVSVPRANVEIIEE